MKKFISLFLFVSFIVSGFSQFTVQDKCSSLLINNNNSGASTLYQKNSLLVRKTGAALTIWQGSTNVATWNSYNVTDVAPTLDSAYSLLKNYLAYSCAHGLNSDSSSNNGNYWTLGGNNDSIFCKMLTNFEYMGVNVYGLQTGVSASEGKFAGLRVLNPPGDFTTVIIGFEDSANDYKSITKSRQNQVETEVEGDGMESELKVTAGILSFGGDAGPYVLSFDREIGLYQIGNINASTDLVEIDTVTGIIRLKASDTINLESNFASISAPFVDLQNVRYNSLPVYANDAAADADSNLPIGATYHLSGDRTIKFKP